VQATPELYNSRYTACAIPDRPYGGHEGVHRDAKIAVKLVDASGAASTEWVAGKKYTVEVGLYAAGTAVHLWLHATAGAPALAVCAAPRSARPWPHAPLPLWPVDAASCGARACIDCHMRSVPASVLQPVCPKDGVLPPHPYG
jgi:hypothetical protein